MAAPTSGRHAYRGCLLTNVTAAVNTAMMDRMDSSRADRADRNGDSKDSKDSKDYKDRDSKGRDSKNHTRDNKDRDKRDRDGRRDKRDRVKCQFCGYLGHELGDCRKMKAAAIAQQQQQPPGQSRNQFHTQNQSQSGVVCYNCQKPGHIAPNCLEPKRLTSSSSAANPGRSKPAHFTGEADTPLYLSVPTDSFAQRVTAGAPEVVRLTHDERVDEQDIIVMDHGQKVEMPLYHVLTQVREKQEVFAFSAPPQSPPPTSVLHSFTRSPGGQAMLTIWDTAALLSLVPMSTVKALNLPFTSGSDISFVVANGSRMAPVGHCTIQFSFPNTVDGGSPMFAEKVYVVDNAPFQLLLGVRFLHRHWAAILIP